jgi:hypothetical protein
MSDDKKNPYQEYWDSLRSIAEEAKEAEKRGEDPQQFIHESVDGSHHIIYTYANLYVLQHGRNEDAVFDQMGSDALSGCNSYGEVMQRMAYYAMLADVEAEFADLPEPEEPEEDGASNTEGEPSTTT